MHEVLVNRFGGLSLPRKSVVRLADRPDMTFDVYRGRKTTIQQFWALLGATERPRYTGFHGLSVRGITAPQCIMLETCNMIICL